MTDYSKLSDFEIVKKVGDVLKLEWANLDDNYNGLCYWKDGDLFVFNPIKDASIGWPIIVDNGISLSPYFNGEWLAAKFAESRGEPGKIIHYHQHQNPLRAAMIVFLMMQENKQ